VKSLHIPPNKEQYEIKMMAEQKTTHPEYEFETFEEWKKIWDMTTNESLYFG
jgi:hypothetical protein